jgi:hypothetical protein
VHPAVVVGIFLLQVAVACRVLIHTAGRPAVALAWIVTVMAVPGLGLLAYLLVGESKFGLRRARRHAAILQEVDVPSVHTQRDARAMQHDLTAEQQQLSLMAGSVSHSPVLSGNRVALSGDSADNIARMVQDIDAATHHVHLLTYIYLLDGAGHAIAEALLRAVARGVQARLLVDDLGSRSFLRSDLRRTLESAGVQVCGALPTSLVRMMIARLDIRNHRKLLVLDGRVAWVGSQNVAEASFAPKARYAPWVDCMLRVEGPLVRELQIVFVEDWFMERDEDLDAQLAIEPPFHTDGVTAQAVATGPNFRNEHMTLLTDVAYAHGGTVDKFVGDLIMVTFGTPKTAADDSMRMLRCARAMVDARERANASVQRPIAIGIGCAYGAVVAGCMGSARRLDYTVLGERVNLAARLCSKAPPMHVYVDATARASATGCAFAPLPPIEAKGFSHPVEAFDLLSVEEPA